MRRIILVLTCCWLGIVLGGCKQTLRDAAVVVLIEPPGGDPVQEPTADLADQAYAQAIRLGGETVRILNNRGYSYMLRGNLAGARRKFEKAYSLDPGNPVIANNLELLDGSRRFIERPPNNQS
ncbi:tetratricopeptide (TPR) repeat protein [Bradyrhizobium sp. USDA 4472]